MERKTIECVYGWSEHWYIKRDRTVTASAHFNLGREREIQHKTDTVLAKTLITSVLHPSKNKINPLSLSHFIFSLSLYLSVSMSCRQPDISFVARRAPVSVCTRTGFQRLACNFRRESSTQTFRCKTMMRRIQIYIVGFSNVCLVYM